MIVREVDADDGVTLAEQEAVAPDPLSEHDALGVKDTIPVGVVAPVAEVSLTVAVHDVDSPINTVDGVQDTVALVGWRGDGLTVTVASGLALPMWTSSPL